MPSAINFGEAKVTKKREQNKINLFIFLCRLHCNFSETLHTAASGWWSAGSCEGFGFAHGIGTFLEHPHVHIVERCNH